MRKQKMYNLEILNTLKVEVNKFKQMHKNETTLNKLLIQAKKEIKPLIRMGYSFKDVAIIFKNIGIEISITRLKKLYSVLETKPKTNKLSKGILSNKNKSINSQIDKQYDTKNNN